MRNNPVGWFEIYVQDIGRAKKFYETVLQGTLERLPSANPAVGIEMWAFPMNSGNASSGQSGHAGAGGALIKMAGVPSGGNSTLVYFMCDDCTIEAGRVLANGGKINRPKMSIGPYGFIALAVDTEGNVFGLHSMR